MSGSNDDRNWRLLLQEMKDRAAMFEAKSDIEKTTSFPIISKEILELGRALGLDLEQCREKLEEVFHRVQSDL
jgi:hypothetical protein